MYSQRDPRWSSIRLGTSTSTIGSDGCLLCCITSILRGTAVLYDPATLNRWLVNHNGYTNGNRFVFGSVWELGARIAFVGNWSKSLADVGKLIDLYDEGFHLIVEVNFYPWGKFVSHWVLVADVGDDFAVFDPWLPPEYVNDPISLLATYCRPDKNLGHAIYRAVAYQVDELPF